MKTVLLTIVLVFSVGAFANPQHEKMKNCNAEAKEKSLKGGERKAFMKDCLAAARAEAKAKHTAQQEKMKTCNADAKEKSLKGKERRDFMKSCLSGTAAAPEAAPAATGTETH